MSYDEMGLDTIGDRKTALFIIISDTDTTFNCCKFRQHLNTNSGTLEQQTGNT